MADVIIRPRQDEEARASAHGARARESAGSMAWTGVLSGLVGLFILNLVLGPVAIGLGIVALRRGVARVTAVSSIALGAADVIVLLVLIALSFSHGALTWHFGS